MRFDDGRFRFSSLSRRIFFWLGIFNCTSSSDEDVGIATAFLVKGPRSSTAIMGTICSSAKNFGLDRFRAIRPVCSSSSDDMIYNKNEDTGSAFCDDTHQNLMVSKKNAITAFGARTSTS
jgi:hypothetical protein